MAGPAPRPDVELPVISWEGQRYRVDVTFDESKAPEGDPQNAGRNVARQALALFDAARSLPGLAPARTTRQGRAGSRPHAHSPSRSPRSSTPRISASPTGWLSAGATWRCGTTLGIVAAGNRRRGGCRSRNTASRGGWRVTGSLLGLDTALGRSLAAPSRRQRDADGVAAQPDAAPDGGADHGAAQPPRSDRRGPRRNRGVAWPRSGARRRRCRRTARTSSGSRRTPG